MKVAKLLMLLALAGCNGGALSSAPDANLRQSRGVPSPSAATATPQGGNPVPTSQPSIKFTATPRPTATPLPTPTPGPLAQVEHVVIVVQENRTPDNLFQGLPGADIATSGINAAGKTVPLQPVALAAPYDLDHTHGAFLTDYDSGKQDGWQNENLTCIHPPCNAPVTPYGYVPATDNAPYIQMAEQYTFADRMFQTNEGDSFPAHQYLLSATSQIETGSEFNDGYNAFYANGNANCGAGTGTFTAAINLETGATMDVPPCFEHITMFDLLDNAGVSYAYYETVSAGIWDAPSAIQHIFYGPDYAAHVLTPSTQVLTAIANGTLPSVSWVIPTGQQSDHPGFNDGTGPSWVSSVVNAIGTSQYWQNTVIFVVWDDWGGWYDHVPPQQRNYYELGFRVPLIVISPYAKRGYVSHVQHEFGSLLKFTEERFGLPSLGYTDVRSDDLSDCFNFTQAPTPFRIIAAPHNAAYFEHLPRSTTPVDTDY